MIRTATAFIFLAGLFNTSTVKAEVQWELSFPFRQMGKLNFRTGENPYFSDQSKGERSWKFREKLYVHDDCMGKSRPILCSERKVGASRFQAMLNSIKRPSNGRYGGVKSNSWIAEAFIDRGNGYSGSQYRYRDQYIRPIEVNGQRLRHRIRVWLDQDDVASKNCEFRVDGSRWYEANCAQGTRLSLFRGDRTSKLEARVQGETQVHVLNGNATKVREVVIAAVGDSYAAGEGAPDIPARVYFPKGKIERKPAKGSGSPIFDNAAHWVERNCHRSYLSSQARAAIHYAAAHPKTETILLHTACSGAEVISGLLGPYSGASEANYLKRRLEAKGEVWRTTLSQYNQLVLALCRDPDVARYKREFNKYFARSDVQKAYKDEGRNLPIQTNPTDFFGPELRCNGGFKKKIDALMIGVSGNDSEFFNVVTHSLLWGPFRKFAGSVSPKKAGEIAVRRTRPLFRLLDRANRRILKVSREKVIVSTYPLGVKDEDGKFCSSNEGLGSFNVIAGITGGVFGGFISRPKVTKTESKNMHDQFGAVLNREIRTAVKVDQRGWKLSDDHVKQFDRHGWCAGDANISRDSSYNPYTLTKRYLRTPDDGFASQNRLPADFEKDRAKLLNQMLKTYGLMHPNGLGAAVMADSYYKKLVQVLD